MLVTLKPEPPSSDSESGISQLLLCFNKSEKEVKCWFDMFIIDRAGSSDPKPSLSYAADLQ